jgi:hypothetical protein
VTVTGWYARIWKLLLLAVAEHLILTTLPIHNRSAAASCWLLFFYSELWVRGLVGCCCCRLVNVSSHRWATTIFTIKAKSGVRCHTFSFRFCP